MINDAVPCLHHAHLMTVLRRFLLVLLAKAMKLHCDTAD